MARAAKSRTKRASNRLYRSAKISEYQFTRVLWAFAQDEAATQAANHIDLSVNSITAIYGKLRRYFYETGLFVDIYQGNDPRDGSALADEEFELRLIEFHISRAADKRGIDDAPEGPAYHFAESHWRFHYAVMNEGRPSEALHRMMFAHLLEMIRCCAPVGAPPINRKAGLELAVRQMDQRILWMERNSTEFRDPNERTELRKIRYDLPP